MRKFYYETIKNWDIDSIKNKKEGNWDAENEGRWLLVQRKNDFFNIQFHGVSRKRGKYSQDE